MLAAAASMAEFPKMLEKIFYRGCTINLIMYTSLKIKFTLFVLNEWGPWTFILCKQGSRTCRQFQNVPEYLKIFQKVPKCSRMFQNIQNVLEFAKVLHNILESLFYEIVKQGRYAIFFKFYPFIKTSKLKKMLKIR